MAIKDVLSKPTNLIAILAFVLAVSGITIIVVGATRQPYSNPNASKSSQAGTASTTSGSGNATNPEVPQPAATTANPPSPASAATYTISITAKGFEPASLTAPKGQNVTWKNTDTTDHAIDPSDNAAGGPHSPQLRPGQSYVYNFTKAGTYKYIDVLHPDHNGSVTVKN